MLLHELKYHARKNRGIPRSDEEQKMYDAVFYDSNFLQFRHLAVMRNGSLATFASKGHGLILAIEDICESTNPFPKNFDVIFFSKQEISDSTVEKLFHEIHNRCSIILANRTEALIRKWIKDQGIKGE